MQPRITARSYYDTNPTDLHTTGDLWAGLPTHGLLPQSTLPGLVITPACDLAHSKVETITYLPVLPIAEWFGSPAFHSDAVASLRAESRLLGDPAHSFAADSTFPAMGMGLVQFEKALADLAPTNARMREALARCRAGIRVCRAIERPTPSPVAPDAKTLLGPKQWTQVLRELVTNYRNDSHFLPADGIEESWSIVRHHSVVLFRYPITTPVTILDAAQDSSIHDWHACVRSLASQVPLALAFQHTRPLKGLTLKKDFLADLLTRYAALYLRIGSPDFSRDTVELFIQELERP